MKNHDREARVIINGVHLSVGQVMTIRVALNALHAQMSEEDALGNDRIGVDLAASYRERAAEVLKLMIEGKPKP